VSAPSGEGRRVVLACDFHRHYTGMLAGALDRAGAGVTMVTRDHDLEFGDEPGAATEFLRREAGAGVDLRILEGRVRSPGGWRRALALRRELLAPGVPIVHAQDSIGNDMRLMVAAGALRRRYALTVHDPVKHPGDEVNQVTLRLNRAVTLNAALIFVHAEALREELIEQRNPKGKIVVIPHASDPGAEVAPLPEEPSILFFGRISHYKGLDVLLDAMEAIWREIPEATLTVAGAGEIEPHPALSDSRVTVRNEHVPEDEVPALMNAARCLALPYRQASQSGVGSRAKPYARPLVVTDVGGLPELVSDGSGLLVPSEDPGRLAETVTSVLRDRALAERLGAAAAVTAERESSWDVVAERTLEAYREHLPAG
jgi:glycosyltransferase involved in cell wall biosynthesis